MIDNTKKAVDIITGQLKGFDTARKLLTLLIYAAYLIYRLISNSGYMVLNIILLACAVLYSCYYVFYLAYSFSHKNVHATIEHIYNWLRILLSAIGTGLTVSAFLSAADSLTTVNLILVILLPLVSVLQIVLELLSVYIQMCIKLLKDGAEKDLANFKQSTPVQAVNGVTDAVQAFKSFRQAITHTFGAFRSKPSEERSSAAVFQKSAVDVTPKEKSSGENAVSALAKKASSLFKRKPKDVSEEPAEEIPSASTPLLEEPVATVTPSVDDIVDPQ